MVKLEEIESYAKNIAAQFKPEKIILFGSYASDSASEDSDVDLLVIMSHEGKASKQALSIRRNIAKRFPLDLVVQSPSEAKRRLSAGDPFIVNAMNQGRVLYAEH
jgi:predicted nucleotidyltransferase